MGRRPSRARYTSLLLTLLTGSAFAQEICPAEAPALGDSCVIGHWIGQNTAAERMEQLLQGSVPTGTSRNVFPTMPSLLGISIYADGLYVTMPLHQSLMWEDITEDDTLLASMDLSMGTTVGRLWTEGSNLHFCTYPPGSVTLLIEGTSALAGSASSVVSPSMGGGMGFTPNMNYHCDASSFNFEVSLPSPIGSVYYDLTRISAERLPAEFRALHDHIEIAE